MPWYVFSLISALGVSITSLIEKSVLKKEHAMQFTAVLAIFVALLSLPFFAVIDYQALPFWPMVYLFFYSAFGALGFYLISKGVRHMEVSVSSPLIALSPGLIAVLSYIFLDEILSQWQVAGLMLLIIGAYALETHRGGSLLEPFRTFRDSKYIHYLFWALLIYGFTAVSDRLVLGHYHIQPEAYLAFVSIFLLFHYMVMLALFNEGWQDVKVGFQQAGWWIFIMAVVTVGYRYSQTYAVSMANVGLASAVKHTSVLLTTVIGGEMFHEKNLFRKTMAAIIICGGVILLVC